MKTKAQRRSRKQEQRIAEEIGGRTQPGSGNTWHSKSDVRAILDLRIEAKYTDQDYYILKRADLFELEDAALRGGLEDWAMQVDFSLFSRKYAIISYRWFLETQPLTQRPLYQSVIDSEAKSLRLHVNEIMTMAGGAAANGGDWSYCLIFAPKDENTSSYALIDWDQFLHLREVAKCRLQAGPSSSGSS